MHRDPLNLDLDTELPGDVVGVATFVPGHELEAVSVVREDALVQDALPFPRIVEDD
jgi:hypothetical protein